ncbi:Immediate-early protein like [Heracleum sosnowskyi]|uniref:Immediate-early protein like n=1 Tax=Heracleum sosnowskyi TaxID=360622 RepID=A0AAD8IU79_9APIA|nr:Immediate-early protein like [Heracleum sosnowskyi]
MASSSAEPINLTGILYETKRIINAHSRHFLALALISLLPISFSITIYPTLLLQLQSLFNNNLPYPKTLILLSTPNPNSPLPLIAPIIFSIFIAFLFICGVSSITYSTFHGFYGRPVRLISSMKCLIWNVVPVVFTVFCEVLFVFLVVAVIGFFMFCFGLIVSCFGVNVEYGSVWYNWFMLVFVIGLVLVLVYVQVHCTLACVVVVVESKWGFEALRRSGVLIKGMRLVSLWLLLFGCVTVVFPLWLNSVPLVRFEGGFDFWKSAGFVAQTVLSSSFVTLFMLICISTNAVLYMYCKALHGELASEIAEEFARDYFSLPFDDEKVPHIVTVVQA